MKQLAYLEDSQVDCALQNAQFLVTGTLGLAYKATGEAMNKAVQISKEGPCQVVVLANPE